MITAIDKPNLVLPLASSYNERGVAGYTHAVTNAEDQRKINCIYEPVKNQMTGKGTLTLSKRPGASACTATLGVTAQVPYILCRTLNTDITTPPVLFATHSAGADLVAIDRNGSIGTIGSATTGYTPRFVQIVQRYSSGVGEENLLFQAASGETSLKAFFSTDAINWTEISDGDIPTKKVGKIEQIDGYLFWLDAGNAIRNSDLNSISAWTAGSFKSKEIKLDHAVGLAKQTNQLLAFGDESVEVFYNAGNSSGSPLGRLAHIASNVGLVNTTIPGSDNGGLDYYCTIGKRIYFVGREIGALNSVGLFSYEGGQFTRASTTYIDKILSEQQASIYSVNSVAINGQMAVSICFTINSDATQRWLMFFPEWKDWFEWTSTIFSPVNCGNWFVGVASKNRVFNIGSNDNWQDSGTSYEWLTQFRVPSNGSSRQIMSMYGVDADTDTSANTVAVAASDDDNASFYSLGTLDLTQDRKVLFRGGSYRKRHIRLSATDARPKRIHSFLARIG